MITRRRLIHSTAMLMALVLLPGCAGLTGAPVLRVNLAGIESLPGEGLELRFMLKLRVQNSGDTDLRFNGVSAEIDLRGQAFASGVAPITGVVPRFDEAVVMLPVTASGLSIARQALDVFRNSREGADVGPVSYALRGRLGGTGLGDGSFESRGELNSRNP